MLVDRGMGADFKIASSGGLRECKGIWMHLTNFGFPDDKALEPAGGQGELAGV